MQKMNTNYWFVILGCLFVVYGILYFFFPLAETFELFSGMEEEQEPFVSRDEYVQRFLKKENRMFPFRYFTDENDKPLPFVAVTGFYREKEAENRYREYVDNGMHMFGITAYKYFPNRAMLGPEEGSYERTDGFEYTQEIRDWLCCFASKSEFGFTDWNHTIDMSESDFYNAESDEQTNVPKKYDFIYICNRDDDDCSLGGWNAINRNFELAKKCFPIMCNEYGLKGLVLGRENCGLQQQYSPDVLEFIGWLDWGELQKKMRECRFLFVPNIYDASPRVVAECITKDLFVLMNREIMCGFKYIEYETGELFSDENDIRPALTNLMKKINIVSPKQWWERNYSQEKSQKKLRDFLAECFPGELDNIQRVKFIL